MIMVFEFGYGFLNNKPSACSQGRTEIFDFKHKYLLGRIIFTIPGLINTGYLLKDTNSNIGGA